MLDLRRRQFITLVGGAAAWPLVARAQQPERMRRVGVLINLAADDPEAPARVAAFAQGLGELGWTVGRNVIIDYRWGGSDVERIRTSAAELVALAPQVILVTSSQAVAILLQATRTVPIVFINLPDPVGAGFVNSLARPGGNITGASFLTAQVAGKRLELLRELIPTATLIDYLVNPDSPIGQPEIADAETAARTHGLKLQVVNVVNARGEYDFDQAFATIARHRPDALFVGGDPIFLSRRHELVSLVARHAIPAIYNQREYAVAGGLMSYGTSLTDVWRQVGVYTGRILKGEKPTDLPVTQSARFELVINLNTAKTLGLKVPLTLQVAADEVIE